MILTPTTTLAAFAGNEDGTYRAADLAIFLIYCTTGKQLSAEEGQAIVEDAKARKKR